MTTNQNDTTIPKRLTATLEKAQAGLRLDQALAQCFQDYSRAKLTEWLKAGLVTLEGVVVQSPKQKVLGNESVVVRPEASVAASWEAEAIPLTVVYEDEALLIVNKPAGLVVHPGAGNTEHTLVNALVHHAPQLATLPRAGIIHRLDKDTTGLLVVAKSLMSHHSLTQQLAAREIARHYICLVYGEIISGSTIAADIGRHPKQRTKMAVLEQGGREAVTHYRVREKFKGFTLLDVTLETGRTHQIRVHLSHMGYPVVGDKVYGARLHLPKGCTPALQQHLRQFQRQALHAAQLSLQHPVNEETMTFTAPIPYDFQSLLQDIKKELPWQLKR